MANTFPLGELPAPLAAVVVDQNGTTREVVLRALEQLDQYQAHAAANPEARVTPQQMLELLGTATAAADRLNHIALSVRNAMVAVGYRPMAVELGAVELSRGGPPIQPPPSPPGTH